MDPELIQILEEYNNSKMDSEVRNLSMSYLTKNWLDITEFTKLWLPIKNSVFNPFAKDLPEIMFNEGFELTVQKAGILFTKEEYLSLQKVMKAAGDDFFVIIENRFALNSTGNFSNLRFKFSVDTTWEDINNGNVEFPDISSYDLILNPQKHFFVFGNSGKWGKYTANDYNDTPLDIIGFLPEIASVFKELFIIPQEEREEIWGWLPRAYKNLIKF